MSMMFRELEEENWQLKQKIGRLGEELMFEREKRGLTPDCVVEAERLRQEVKGLKFELDTLKDHFGNAMEIALRDFRAYVENQQRGFEALGHAARAGAFQGLVKELDQRIERIRLLHRLRERPPVEAEQSERLLRIKPPTV